MQIRTILYAIISRQVAACLCTCDNIVCTEGVRCRGERNRYHDYTTFLKRFDDPSEGFQNAMIDLGGEIFLYIHE